MDMARNAEIDSGRMNATWLTLGRLWISRVAAGLLTLAGIV